MVQDFVRSPLSKKSSCKRETLMAHKKNTTNLTELLLQCVTQPDPMLSMLEWLCTHLMEAEVDQQLGAEKSQRTDGRSGYRSGYRPRRLDTRMGTMYLCSPGDNVSHGIR